ncbi:MAG: Fe-S cluster assembly protein SufD [Crocinitomicaceae bacterium]|nr:Fe-S cluster assembly protein SufD [Crocinitomicaceae bacterium]MDG1775904.1 Fe-S cluster assembly protein SufD [Crocinitomicaceae bacterium]
MTELTKNNINFKSDLQPTTITVSEHDKQKALAVLQNTPLPTTRVEAWKYTRVAKLGKIDFVNNSATIDNISSYVIDDTNCSFVFINGHFSKEHSSQKIPAGVSITLLSEVNSPLEASSLKLEGEVFNAMNTAHLTGGLQIDIAPNALIETPVQIIHILKGDNILANFKTIVNAEKSAQAEIIQGFFSESGEHNFCNSTSEINVAENAVLRIDKIQYESEKSFHISTEQVQQDKNSNFRINTFTLNGGLVRNNLNIDVNGQNCETHLNGAYLLKNKQHVDNHSVVDHKVAHCESHELYKGVIDDNSTAVFNGKVFVRPDAQKINAFQSNGNVLLSDSATINSKPELEIYADDVKCSHGSTTGQLDEEAIFYLRARGLSEKSARHLMVSAFIGDVLDKITNENIKTYTHRLLNDRFGWEF